MLDNVYNKQHALNIYLLKFHESLSKTIKIIFKKVDKQVFKNMDEGYKRTETKQA